MVCSARQLACLRTSHAQQGEQVLTFSGQVVQQSAVGG
jgi:hypothetical protein